jgi:hypothetical protein
VRWLDDCEGHLNRDTPTAIVVTRTPMVVMMTMMMVLMTQADLSFLYAGSNDPADHHPGNSDLQMGTIYTISKEDYAKVRSRGGLEGPWMMLMVVVMRIRMRS